MKNQSNARPHNPNQRRLTTPTQPEPNLNPTMSSLPLISTDDDGPDGIFGSLLHNDLEYLGEKVIFADTPEDRLEHWKAFEVSELI